MASNYEEQPPHKGAVKDRQSQTRIIPKHYFRDFTEGKVNMARRVFFSFHYQNDIWRVSQVRNCWRTQGGDTQQFLDAASWESVKRSGAPAVMAWIDRQLTGTGVTVVLIGEKTSERPYVKHEIRESHNRGNGLLGIYIHKLKNQRGEKSYKGLNPFSHMTANIEESSWLGLSNEIKRRTLSTLYPTYDWIDDNGYKNIRDWIEEAARAVGR